MKWILVFVGSGLGGCLRLFTSEISARYLTRSYPLGTFTYNFLACLLLGFVLAFFDQTRILDTRMRLFLGVGICGGYSTFSTFSNEVFQLFASQKIMEALLYAAGSFAFGLLAIYLGFSVATIFK